MAILTTAFIGSVIDIASGLLKGEEPTPEQQREKAGVWYKMLRDLVLNETSPERLASNWRDQLPFKQKNTKKRFMENNVIGRLPVDIIDTLVQKINDELVKGGFSQLSKEAILAGMGASGHGLVSSTATKSVSGGASPLFVTSEDVDLPSDVNEGRAYFYAGGILLVVVGVAAWLFLKPKRRRRRR